MRSCLSWPYVLGSRESVDEVIQHPENDYIYYADISLLRLQQPLTTTATIRPACLPTRVHQWSTNIPCYVSGWGVTDVSDLPEDEDMYEMSSILHHAKVKLWPQGKCKAVYPARLIPSMICAGYEHGEIDACKGDSGGPLVCQDARGAWQQVGVVSWGRGCGTKGMPGVYTRVDSFLEWISNVTAERDISVTCDFETSAICGYVTNVNATSSFLWTRRSGGRTLPPRPVEDNTRSDDSGHYMYVHVDDDSRHEKATLYTPRLNFTSAACLTIHVFFFADTDAVLTVNAVAGQKSNQSEEVMRLEDGHAEGIL
nr:hypothetical protein BaRGS_033347 [Batillaria attramentaria]